MDYNFKDIEDEVKKFWKEEDVYKVENNSSKKKFYVLDMFPYPSGAGLHVGHPLGYIASDIYARYKRLKGFNVLHPMGFDSFGLPAEQYAIQTGQHPADTTAKNISTFREQLDKIGFSFDWSRELRTSDPEFYKWTQWIFIKLFHSWYNKKTGRAEPIETLIEEFLKNGNGNVEAACGDIRTQQNGEDEIFLSSEWDMFSKKQQSDILLNYRLAYLADSWVNWCPALGTVLANDEVKEGVSERGGYPVERKLMKQWSLRITAYADRLLKDLEKLEWSEAIKETQRNWIGRSEGCSIWFEVKQDFELSTSEFSVVIVHEVKFADSKGLAIEVFTTRPDTIFGATFITLAPEHDLVSQITTPEYKTQVEDYVTYAKNRSERDRMTDVKKITGQFTGAYAIHPFTKELIPIWIGEYVLATYGTGAVMGVPGHDERDHRFATHFKLRIISIIEGVEVTEKSFDAKEGTLCNSGFLNGLKVSEAIKYAIDRIEDEEIGERRINFKMRDAVFGRQRYWGEPIPVYYDQEGIPHTVDVEDLPVVLPEVDKYLPTEDGEPPLARARDWFYRPHLSSPKDREAPEHDTAQFGYQTSNQINWEILKENARKNRKQSTQAESILWNHLSDHQLGVHFRRQHVIGNFIADFVCLKKNLIVEVDGGIHLTQVEEDKAREEELQNHGFRIIRFTNEEVTSNLDIVLTKIKIALDEDQSNPPLSGDLERPQMLLKRVSNSSPSGNQEGESNSFPWGNQEGEFNSSPSGRRGGALETTTMPGWAGSSWYFLRYEDPHNKSEFASKKTIDYWQNIDLYVGGDEHATGHLLYFRFWTKFLFDLGLIPFDEPAKKMMNQGKIQGVSDKIYYESSKKEDSGEIRSNGFLFISETPWVVFLKYYNSESDDQKTYVIYGGGKERMEIYKFNNHRDKNVPINLVENNVLNVEQLCITNKTFKGSVFVVDAGFHLCDYDGSYKFVKLKEGDANFYTINQVEKMSKSKYNVVNPDDVVEKYGADVFRLYEMFLGPIEQSKPWDTKGIDGVHRFIRKFWKLFFDEQGKLNVTDEEPTKEEFKILHRTIKKIGDDIETLSYNTSVSAFMICVNDLTKTEQVSPLGRFRGALSRQILEPLLIILSPFAPFVTEYLWQQLGHQTSITKAVFPEYDPLLLVESTFEYPVAVNGKTRLKMNFALELPADQIEKEVLTAEGLQKYFDGKNPRKVIVVKGKMINVVV